MSTTAFLRKVPRSRKDWERWHFGHYLDHLRILGVVNAKIGTNYQMPSAIWPFSLRNQYPYNEAHQLLHQQMDAVSQTNPPDFLHVDLSKPAQVPGFIWFNWLDHNIFHQLVGGVG